jgi:hypothetical protein
MTEPETPAPNAEEKTKGRPRPEETKARDTQVLAIVTEAGGTGITRQGVAGALGEDVKSSHAYLSLFRLHRDGLIKRERAGGKHVWLEANTELVVPEPAPATEPAPVA